MFQIIISRPNIALFRDSRGKTALDLAAETKLRWAVNAIIQAVVDKRINDHLSLSYVAAAIPALAKIHMLDCLAPALSLEDCQDAVFCPMRARLDLHQKMMVKGSEVQEPATLWGSSADEHEAEADLGAGDEHSVVVPVKAQRALLPALIKNYSHLEGLGIADSPFHALNRHAKHNFEIFNSPAMVVRHTLVYVGIYVGIR